MTPKEKADNLVSVYIDFMPTLENQTVDKIMTHAKQCALIAVNEKRDTLSEALPYGLQYLGMLLELDEIETEIKKL